MLDSGPGIKAEDQSLEGVGIGLRNTVDRLHEFMVTITHLTWSPQLLGASEFLCVYHSRSRLDNHIMQKLRTIIVDDEPLALTFLRLSTVATPMSKLLQSVAMAAMRWRLQLSCNQSYCF